MRVCRRPRAVCALRARVHTCGYSAIARVRMHTLNCAFPLVLGNGISCDLCNSLDKCASDSYPEHAADAALAAN